MIKWLRRLGLAVVVAIAVVVVLRVGFGLHVYMDGDFGLHLAFGKPSAHYDALEAQRAAQRAAPPAARPPRRRHPAAPAAAATDRPRSPQPRAAAHGPTAATDAAPQPATSQPAAPPAAVAGSWTEFRGPARDGVYRQRPVAATWPAGGPRLLWKQPVGEGPRVVRGRARRRLHDRAAPQSGGGRRLRHRHRPRTLDARLGRVLLGTRWAATARAPRRPTPTASSTPSARPASCARCGPTPARSCGAPTSSTTPAPRTCSGACPPRP